MFGFQLALVLLLIPLCCFSPGFFFLRKLRWNPLEKLTGSIGLSLILIYLVSWIVYCLGTRGDNMPIQPAPYIAVSVACAALGFLSAKDILRLFRAPSVRRAMVGFGFLLVFAALMLSAIRVYSGAGWFADWLEHFQRTLFFLRHFPAETPIFPGYALPARPPMLNVITGFFLAQTSDRFELFQVVFAILNLLVFLPCCLMMPLFARRARRRTWLLVLLFASSPVLMQNVTYSWTKAAAAFYVVMAIWFYLAGWRKRDSVRMTAAFIALAAGLIVHYSAGPYVVILTAHYLLRVFPTRQNKWRELAGIAAICGILVGTWLGWSLSIFGTHFTFASNSSVTASQEYKGSTLEKMASNLFDSIVPVVARQPDLLDQLHTQRTAGMLRDWFFIFYQVNVIFAMGIIGGPLVLWLAYRALRRPREIKPPNGKRPAVKTRPVPKSAAERQFWMILIGMGVLLGIAVVGERDAFGSAHLTLLSLQMIGLTLLAATIPWRPSLAYLLLAGCLFDFSFGVFLQARVESLENSPGVAVFPEMEFTSGRIQTAAAGPDSLGHSPWDNWFTKHRLALYAKWYREFTQQYGSDPAFRAILPQFQQGVAKAYSDDHELWQGWFGRHDGQTEYLGDHLGGTGTTVAMVLFVAMYLALAAYVIRLPGEAFAP